MPPEDTLSSGSPENREATGCPGHAYRRREFTVPGMILSGSSERERGAGSRGWYRKGQRVTRNNYKSDTLCTLGRMRKERQVLGVGAPRAELCEGDAAFFH